MPKEQLVLVEFPGYVENVKRALEMLGPIPSAGEAHAEPAAASPEARPSAASEIAQFEALENFIDPLEPLPPLPSEDTAPTQADAPEQVR